jgi:Protein of unknown function (DUF3592)
MQRLVNSNPITLCFLIIPVMMGLVFIAIGVGIAWSSWALLSGGQRADGTVVEMVRVESSTAHDAKGRPISTQPVFTPVVQYQVGGKTHRIQGHVSTVDPAYPVGGAVIVLYLADEPADGRIDSFAEMWLAPLVFGGGGLLFTLVGFGLLIQQPDSSPPRDED